MASAPRSQARPRRAGRTLPHIAVASLLAALACRPGPAPTPTPVSAPESTASGFTREQFVAWWGEWQDMQARAAAAIEAGEFLVAAKLLREASETRGYHPGLRYELARALARDGRPDMAFPVLAELAQYRFAFSIVQDPAFAGMQHDPRFAEIVTGFAAARRPESPAEPRRAGSFTAPTFMPECAEPDRATGGFYVSSVHERRIVRLDASGRVDDFVPPGRHGLWSVLGLRLDAARNLLWATTAATTATRDVAAADAGQSALLAFRLEDGSLAGRYPLGEPGVSHTLGDLALMPGGAIVASDASAGAIYILDSLDAPLRPLVPPGTLMSPQGLVADESGTRLYVADYALGLFVFDLTDPAAITIHPLYAYDPYSFVGIDGLDRAERSLVIVQNGVAPARVLRLQLDYDGLGGGAIMPLLHGLPEFDEPTLVRVAGDVMFVVANSHWNRLDEAGGVPAEARGWTGPVILTAPHGYWEVLPPQPRKPGTFTLGALLR